MELPISTTYINFSCHHLCCFIVGPLFVLNKSMAWNKCLQHPCFKFLCRITQGSKNLDSNAQHFLSDLLTHSWFHSMLFALPCYQFPYNVMNRCLYLSLPLLQKGAWLATLDTLLPFWTILGHATWRLHLVVRNAWAPLLLLAYMKISRGIWRNGRYYNQRLMIAPPFVLK
jgi:hypothetical protein